MQKDALQLGVGYPYYYLWVKVIDVSTNQIVEQGMLGAKAVDKLSFGIGKLNTADAICKDDFCFPSFFPEELCKTTLVQARLVNKQ